MSGVLRNSRLKPTKIMLARAAGPISPICFQKCSRFSNMLIVYQ